MKNIFINQEFLNVEMTKDFFSDPNLHGQIVDNNSPSTCKFI